MFEHMPNGAGEHTITESSQKSPYAQLSGWALLVEHAEPPSVPGVPLSGVPLSGVPESSGEPLSGVPLSVPGRLGSSPQAATSRSTQAYRNVMYPPHEIARS